MDATQEQIDRGIRAWADHAYYPLINEAAIIMLIDNEGNAKVFSGGQNVGIAADSLQQLNKEISKLEKRLAALRTARDWLKAHPRKKAVRKNAI